MFALALTACGGGGSSDGETGGTEAGVDPTISGTDTDTPETGDASQTGDGDGDPGDGDGDGDGEPGDGDGEPGDGDGDGDGDTCGNGVVDGNEECDDGNDIDDDDCTNACKNPPSPCGTQAYQATLDISPVDIIISIDNSGSMGEEIQGVQDNINVNFVQIIEAAGLDYRVIMVARHGSLGSESVCIEAPLSGIPMGGCANPPPAPVHNPPIFYHYSTEIASHDMWCELLAEYPNSASDSFGENGWGQWLRVDAVKTFIAISDDGISCGPYNDGNQVNAAIAEAADFDAALLALDPAQFGDVNNRRYSYFSIVGMGFNNPPTDPYPPMHPILTSECPSAADPGTGHQALSVLTGALRFPLCDTSSYDAVFSGIAQSVIAGSPVSCELPLPVAPDNQLIDPASLVITYTPGGMGNPIILQQVMGPQDCVAEAYYIANEIIYLCPETCALVQGDFDAQIDMEYGCIDPS